MASSIAVNTNYLKQIYLTHRGTLTPGESGPGHNSNEGVHCTSQDSRTEALKASPSDKILCHT